MRDWWVNQKKTYKHEVEGGFMWSLKSKANGHRNPFYDTMREVVPGDLVFSYSHTRVKALGVVTGPAQSAPKPNFGFVRENWADEGWLVSVEYCELDTQIR